MIIVEARSTSEGVDGVISKDTYHGTIWRIDFENNTLQRYESWDGVISWSIITEVEKKPGVISTCQQPLGDLGIHKYESTFQLLLKSIYRENSINSII